MDLPVTHAHTNRLHGVKRWAAHADYVEPALQPDVMWLVLGVVSTLIVVWNDGVVLTTSLWLVGLLLFGQVLFPFLQYQARYGFLHTEKLYLGVIMGWAIVAGPMTAAAIGPLLPYMLGLDFPSYVGGLLAMLIAPPFAALEGILIVGTVDLVVWLWSGKSLQRRI